MPLLSALAQVATKFIAMHLTILFYPAGALQFSGLWAEVLFSGSS
jgi:hypothetical protein